jgi:hypothetical protein
MIALTIFLLGGAEFFGRPWIEFISLGIDHFFHKADYHPQTSGYAVPATGIFFLVLSLVVSFWMLFQAIQWFKKYKNASTN